MYMYTSSRKPKGRTVRKQMKSEGLGANEVRHHSIGTSVKLAADWERWRCGQIPAGNISGCGTD